MMVRIPLLDYGPCSVCPPPVSIKVQIIAEIPGDIRKSSEPVDCIVNETVLIRAAGLGMNATVMHVKHERDDHVPASRITKSSVKSLPIGNVKAPIIKSGMENVLS